MKALVLNAPGALSLKDTKTPQTAPGDVLIRVRSATLCGTDMRIYRGQKTAGVRYPSVLGHEFAGQIVETGDHDGLAIGDRVAVCPAIACGHCEHCKRGRENLCAHGENVGYQIDGAFAELIRIPARAIRAGNLRHLPDHLGFDEAALLEPLACVINGQRQTGLDDSDTVVVLGAGPIGLLHVGLARLKGAMRIIVSDPNAPRREAALAMGADHVIDPRNDDVLERVREHTDGHGADVVICAIGRPALAREATDLAAHGGRVNLFAGFAKGQTAEMDVNAIHYREIQVSGAFGLSRATFDHAFDLVAAGRLDLSAYITHRYALDQALDAFETAESDRAAIKVAIVND